MASKKKYFYAVGRRKTARAVVRLFLGRQKTTVNDQSIEKYFPGAVLAAIYEQPLRLTKTLKRVWARIVVKGGGKHSQAEAVRLALARALVKMNAPLYKQTLKQAGLLTVDARVRERRKAGQMGRARKKKQSPKR